MWLPAILAAISLFLLIFQAWTASKGDWTYVTDRLGGISWHVCNPPKSFYFIIDLPVQALTCLPKGMIQPIIVMKLMSRDRYCPIQSIPRISRLSYYWLTRYHPFAPSLFIHHKGIRKNQELSFRAISLCDRVCTLRSSWSEENQDSCLVEDIDSHSANGMGVRWLDSGRSANGWKNWRMSSGIGYWIGSLFPAI